MTVKENVSDFARLLSTYDSSREIEVVRKILKRINVEPKEILDVGCGTGRFTSVIRSIFPNSNILAIDIDHDSVEYDKENYSFLSVRFIECDATEFFRTNDEKYDLVIYSWSFFDMCRCNDFNVKNNVLLELLNNTKKSLNDGGAVIILQPTKKGTFELLLSKFLPESDDDYYFVNSFLNDNLIKDFGVPDELEIWSSFNFETIDILFKGISSIVKLELDQELDYDLFLNGYNKFLKDNTVEKTSQLSFSDCVQAYCYIKP